MKNMMSKRWTAIIFGLTAILVLDGCTLLSSFATLFQPLAYANNSETLLLYANYKTWPGPYELGQTCNLIPDLRIWGDGRFVKVEYDAGVRLVTSGYLSKAEIKKILVLLEETNYFGLDDRISIVPAATGLELDIHLSKKSYEYFSWQPEEAFFEIIKSVHSENEAEYVPTQALLFTRSAVRPFPVEESYSWPADAQFRLSDVSKDGLWIEGKELEMIWEAVNNDPLQMPVFIEEGIKYGMILQIPGVSSQDPPYDC